MRARLINEAFGQKDLVRMQDIKTKSAGNHDKEISLATTQAKIIQDAGKAQARAEAAEEVFGSESDISQIFHDRAVELGGSSVRSVASKAVLAPVVGPVGKGEKLERKFKTRKEILDRILNRIITIELDAQNVALNNKGKLVKGIEEATDYFIDTLKRSGVEWKILELPKPPMYSVLFQLSGSKEQLIPMLTLWDANGRSKEELAELLTDWEGDENQLWDIIG
jgi:hypothetical protein